MRALSIVLFNEVWNAKRQFAQGSIVARDQRQKLDSDAAGLNDPAAHADRTCKPFGQRFIAEVEAPAHSIRSAQERAARTGFDSTGECARRVMVGLVHGVRLGIRVGGG